MHAPNSEQDSQHQDHAFLPMETMRPETSLETFCEYKGELFRVVGASADGLLQLVWTGHDRDRAAELGLTEAERAEYVDAAPREAVSQLRQTKRPIPQRSS